MSATASATGMPVRTDPENDTVFEESIAKGLAAGNRSRTEFDVAPFVTVALGDDVEQCMMPIRGNMALYIGGMGARDKNFYNNYAKRLGFEEEAVNRDERVQRFRGSDRSWLAGVGYCRRGEPRLSSTLQYVQRRAIRGRERIHDANAVE